MHRNQYNREVFNIPQKYMLAVNDSADGGSVTYCIVSVEAETEKLKFFWAFRRFLKATGVDVLRYCHEAGLHEVLCCVEYPEVK